MLPVLMRSRILHDPFELMTRELDRVFGTHTNDALAEGWAPYAVDVHEDNDHFYVEAELPGFMRDDIEVTLENGMLTIRAERNENKEEKSKKGEPLHVERRWTKFQRSFSLPTQVNENDVRADLHHGILQITLNKREEVKPRKIQIDGDGKTAAGSPTTGGIGGNLNAGNSGSTQASSANTAARKN